MQKEKLIMLRRTGFFTKSNVQKQKSNNQKCTGYLGCISKINKIHCSSVLSMTTVNNKKRIPNPISLVKTTTTSKEENLTKLGVINAIPNQPAARLINNPENALSHGLVKKISTNLLYIVILALSRIKIAMSFPFILYTLYFILFPTPALATNSGPFTAEVWVKPTSSIASQAILGKSEELRIFTDASGYVGCQIKATTWQTAAQATTTALTLNQWAHIACTYDKVNLRVYVNGSQTALTALTSAPDDTANAFLLGQDDSASTPYSNLTGVVDNFQFYNYARSAKQVVQDMEGGSVIASGARQSAIAYYKFDEGNGQTANNSGNGGTALNGTLGASAASSSDDPTWTNSGKFGKALSFDGGDRATITSNASIDLRNNLTVTAWFNLNSITDGGFAKVFSKRQTDGWGPFEVSISRSGSTISVVSQGSTTGSSWDVQAGSTTISTGNWHHVALIVDSDNLHSFYVNGVLKGTQQLSNSLMSSSTYDFLIGTGGGFTLNGSIDEVKIYNYALTKDEILTEYNHGQTLQLGAAGSNSSYEKGAANQEYCIPGDSTSCAAPVAEWRFDENSGTTVADKSGNGNTGTWNGTGVHWTPGKISSAGQFNGVNDHVNVGGGSSLNPTNITVEAWWKPTADFVGNGSNPIVDKGYTSHNSPYYQYHLWTVGALYPSARDYGFYVTVGGTGYTVSSSGIDTYALNQWNFMVGTYDGETVKIYRNGKLINSNADPSGDMSSYATNAFIGNFTNLDSSVSHTPGLIDNVKIYNYARSAAQINWDYNRGAPVGHWKFNECQGSVAHDSAGTNNGTITIGPSGSQTSQGTCTSSGAWYNGVTGKYNSSLNFDGTDDKITIPNAITGVQSVSFWVNPAVTTDSFMDLDGGTHYITASSGTVSATGFSTPTIYVNGVSGGTITGGVWNHVVVTTATSFNSTSSFTLGYKSAATADYLNGQLDDVQIYNYALTSTQIKNLYNQNSAIRFGPVTGSP